VLLHPIPGVANGGDLVMLENVAPNGDPLPTVGYPTTATTAIT